MPFMPLAAMGLLATVMLIVWLAPCARRSTGDGWTLTVEVPGVGHAFDDEALADVGDVHRDAVGGTQAPGPLLGSVCGGEHGLDAWAILGEHVVCDSQALHGNPLKSGVGRAWAGGRDAVMVDESD